MQHTETLNPAIKPALGLRGGQDGVPAGLLDALELAGWKIEEMHGLHVHVRPHTQNTGSYSIFDRADASKVPACIATALQQLRQTRADLQRARQQLTTLQFRHYHYKVRNMKWCLERIECTDHAVPRFSVSPSLYAGVQTPIGSPTSTANVQGAGSGVGADLVTGACANPPHAAISAPQIDGNALLCTSVPIISQPK